jgi:hypothetical protein
MKTIWWWSFIETCCYNWIIGHIQLVYHSRTKWRTEINRAMLRCKKATCAWNIGCYGTNKCRLLKLLYSIASSADVIADLTEISHNFLPETSLRNYLSYLCRSCSANKSEMKNMLFRNYFFFNFVAMMISASSRNIYFLFPKHWLYIMSVYVWGFLKFTGFGVNPSPIVCI